MEKPFAYHFKHTSGIGEADCLGLSKTLESLVERVLRKNLVWVGLAKVYACFEDGREIEVPPSVYLKKFEEVRQKIVVVGPGVVPNLAGSVSVTRYAGEEYFLLPEEIRRSEAAWLETIPKQKALPASSSGLAERL